MRPVEVNPAKLALLFMKEFRLCNVRPGETIVMITDLNSPPAYVAAAFAAGDKLGADVYEMKTNTLSSWVRLGEETVGKAKGMLEALRAADLIACLHLRLFTKWLCPGPR
jgi:2,5-dihydroxypyridine 5,6-dioxygenase